MRTALAIGFTAAASFLAGYVFVTDDGFNGPAIAFAAVFIAIPVVYNVAAGLSLLSSVTAGMTFGCLIGAAFGLGLSTPHLAEIGDRTRDTWTEIGWQVAVVFLVTVFGIIGVAAGAGAGLAMFTFRKLSRGFSSYIGNHREGYRT